MKPASAELVSLLASSRQVAIWEEFTFTLADDSVLTYSTRDRDALPAIVAPPPAPAAWLLDTFTGAAAETLATHIGEVGATWSNGTFGYPAGAVDFVLSGTGSVAVVGSTGQVRASGLPPDDTSDFYLEASLRVGSFATVDLWILRLSPFNGVYVSCGDIGTTNIVLSATASNDTESFSNFGVNSGVPYAGGVDVVLWCEVTAGRTVVSYGVGAFRGDNQLVQFTFAAPLASGINAVQMVATPTATIYSIEGGPL